MAKTRWLTERMLLLAIAGTLVPACRGGALQASSAGSEVENASHALTAAEIDRILGFEATTVSDWSIVESGPGTLAVSTTHSQGTRSLAVSAHGFVPVQSVAMTSLGSRVENVLRYDLMLPSELSSVSPYWYGTTQVYIEIPSLGVNNSYIGQVELTGLPLGQWKTMTFTPSSEMLAKLRGTYSDLRVKIVVNAPYNATQPYLLDNLRFGEGTPSAAEVTVVDGGGFPISGMTVTAYDGSTPTSNTGVTNTTGIVNLVLPAGSYRFGVTEAGVTTYSSPTNHCLVPGSCPPSVIVVKCHNVVCTASDTCHEAGTCDPGTGFCSNPAKPAGTVCRPAAGPCDAAEVCAGTGAPCPSDGNLPDGASCDDSNGCTQNDVCSAGACAGLPVVCPAPSNTCLESFCLPLNGQCTIVPADGKACDDGNPATANDICVSGICAPSTAADRCGTDDEYKLRLVDPLFAQHRREIAEANADFQARAAADPESAARTGLFIIPVVVHILWNTAAQNITDAQVQRQIAILNEDYRRLNADRTSVPAEFAPVAADSRIEFRLAARDPTCAATTGITRTNITATDFEGRCGTDPAHCDDMKSAATGGHDPWPSGQYLNIWVLPLRGGLLGRGTFPGEPAATDGVIVRTTAFGDTAPAAAPFDHGRTLTHEVGHWLDLFHTFQGGCSGLDATTCAAAGDRVCDTPADSSPTYDCPGTQNTCTDTPTDGNDPTMDFMDYTDDLCMFMFTSGQASRAAATLNGARAGILGSAGALAPPAPTWDLWSQDTPEDTGAEANTLSTTFYISDDIWVRNAADGTTNQEHQNPLYRPSGPPNHVYVRVRNLGCSASPSANVKAYWASASVNLGWPTPWDGTVTSPALMGSPLGTKAIPSLAAGASTIVDFDWSPPNPADYAGSGADGSHFCLLSRIETSSTAPFGMHTAEGSDLLTNVRENNNVVWKNVTVVSDGTSREAEVTVQGTSDNAPLRLEFIEPAFPIHPTSVFDWGQVVVELSPKLMQRWLYGGQQGTGVVRLDDTKLLLVGSSASISNIYLRSDEIESVHITFQPGADPEVPNREKLDVYLLDVSSAVFRCPSWHDLGGQRVALKTYRPIP